jgi:hypothetical protein
MTPLLKRGELEVPVVVEVDAAVPGLAAAAERALGRLEMELADLLERVGLRGRPVVAVEEAESTRALRVRVHGVLQPYDQRLARQVWLAVAQDPVRQAALRFEADAGSSTQDAWLRAALDDAADTATLSEFIWRLVVAVVEQRAACLVGPGQVAEYGPELAGGRGSSPDGVLGYVLRTLLGLGVWAADRDAVVRAIQQGARREPADIAETLLARLRPRRVEIHVNPVTLPTLLAGGFSRSKSIAVYAGFGPDAVRAEFQDMEDSIYLDFGLRLPDLFWVPSEQVAPETVAVRINEVIGVGLPLPPEGMVLVNAVPSSLPQFDAQPALGPAGPSGLIREEDAPAVEAMGYSTFDRLAFVQYLVFTEARRNAARMLSSRDAEFELHRSAQPALVRAVLERWSLGEVTRVLRELLDGGLSIRDMRTVLECLLRFDTIEVDADSSTVFDDRLPVDGPLPSMPLARARMLARFVREGMSDFIGNRFSFGTDRMVVYLLDSRFEQLALEVAPDDLEGDTERPEAEATLDLLRDAVWHELSYLPPAAATPVVLTSRRARTAVRRVTAAELPDLRVVRFSEIPASLNVMPVARIAAARAGVPAA